MRLTGILNEALYQQLVELPEEQQARMVRMMAERLSFGNALSIHYLLEQRMLKMPILQVVPYNTLVRIAKYLDYTSLLSLAFTSNSFLELVMNSGDVSDEIWASVMKYADRIPDEVVFLMAQTAANASHLRVRDYLKAYKYFWVLNRNWTLNLCRTAVVEIPGARTITDMSADWETKRLFVAADDSIVRVYTFDSGLQLSGILSGHQGGVWCMKSVGDILITGSTDRSIGIWDLTSMTRRIELVGHSSTVRSILVFGAFLVSGSRDGVIKVWEWMSGRFVRELIGHSGSIRCLDVYEDRGKAFIVSGSYDETVIVWSLDDGRPLKRLKGHSGRIYALKVYNGFIYSAGVDHCVKKWDPFTGECVADIGTGQSLIGTIVVQDKYIVTGSTDGKICVIDCHSNDLIYTIQIESTNRTPQVITSVSLNRNFIFVTSDTSCYLFNLETGEKVNTVIDNGGNMWRGCTTEICCFVAYHQSDSTRLFAADFGPQPLPAKE